MAFKVPLHNRLGLVVAHALVDDQDARLVSGHSWHLANSGYAASRIGGRIVLLHRLVLGHPEKQVDHRNRDRLDCRRANLREVSDAENKQNVPARGGSSDFRGVSWSKAHGKWMARYGQHHRRLFDSELDAAQYIADWRAKNLSYSEEAAG